MYKACLFDLDGTLLDTVESIAHVANQVLTHYGLDSVPVELFNYFAGDGADELIRRCFVKTGGDLSYLDEARQMYRDLFAKDPLYHVRAYEGMPETLLELRERGVHLAVCTNKPHPAAVGAIHGIYGDGLFDVIQGQMPSIPRKPAPDSALLIAHRLGVKPEECMYVGDTDTDMKTGNRACMLTIGVLWGFRERGELEEHHAHYIIERPEELLDIQRKRGKYHAELQ
ncbi:HAD family hydrolase [Ruminococcus gauvreauii]|uniref:HAD family hydrolase n=1 Tax=Ruminococcus gauvreauii TaxID=438033 RepID=A0ABY5VEG8_9FIRM|nr:HAD family hydrolase [Ruminococcus gauvreauii]UWP58651.1 HAD family hydrolase [Ruminococcus gauvreauii]